MSDGDPGREASLGSGGAAGVRAMERVGGTRSVSGQLTVPKRA